jgi:hypothetical protein
MENNKIINSIRQLKEIKPREEWVSLLKSQIIAKPEYKTSSVKTNPLRLKDFISNFTTQWVPRIKNYYLQPAYAFAVVLLLFVGVVSVSQFVNLNNQTKILTQSVASLEAKALGVKVNNLAQFANNGEKENVAVAYREAKEKVVALEKALKSNPTKDSEMIKEIVANLKTLASVQGTEMEENSEIEVLYKTIVESQITDLEEVTLTEEQMEELKGIKELYSTGDYMEALEKILLINDKSEKIDEKIENSK